MAGNCLPGGQKCYLLQIINFTKYVKQKLTHIEGIVMNTVEKEKTTEKNDFPVFEVKGGGCCAPEVETVKENASDIKDMVREKYAAIAVNAQSGCGCCGPEDSNKIVGYTVMADEYTNKEGYVAEADLGLGCGIPVDYAEMKAGDTVVDLGAGAGNDVFVARAIVGETGHVIGIDMTPEMISKARQNNQKLGYTNVEFRLGEIENMPVQSDTADVVISNCVLNLVPDKARAFAEIYRILKPGAHFCVSDIVLKGTLPPELKKSAEMYAGCVAGAMQQEDYLAEIEKAGFTGTVIKKTKVITLPDEVLKQYLNEEQIQQFRRNDTGIFSITVNAYKK